MEKCQNETFKHIVITDAITLEIDKSDILSIPLTYMVIIPMGGGVMTEIKTSKRRKTHNFW